jgi:hypothetical protein
VSPIVQIQRRMMELGRVRLGSEKMDGKVGHKLDNFRFTSPSRALLEAIADKYGGSVTEWASAPEEGYFQVLTESPALDIVLPPVFSDQDGTPTLPFSQWLEDWSRGGCKRRCDGVTEAISGKPCLCQPDVDKGGEAARVCKPTTRLSFMLPDIPGLGVWRVESKGWNAAAELPGTLVVLQRAAEEGKFIPAVLRLERRTSKKDGETHRFVVPVIDLPNVTINQLASGDVPLAINGPTATPPKPALPPAVVEPPADPKFEGQADPDWPDPPPIVEGNYALPEHVTLANKLLDLAEGLDRRPQTHKAIGANRLNNVGQYDKHIAWLKGQIARAEKKLTEGAK